MSDCGRVQPFLAHQAKNPAPAWKTFAVIEQIRGLCVISRVNDRGHPTRLYGEERLVVPLNRAQAVLQALNQLLA